MNAIRPSRGMGTVVLSAALASVVGISSQANAQAWLPDRAYTEGPGIRAGDLEIHPGIAVRGGYDNNVFRADGKARTGTFVDPNTGATQTRDATQKIEGAPVLAVTPHIHLSTLSQQRRTQGEDREGEQRQLPPIAFRGGLSATYFHYFLDDAPKNIEIDSDLWLGILPQRPVNMDIALAYARNVRAFTQNAGDKNAYTYDTIAPRARLNVGSRSQVLTAYLGYAPRVTIYESDIFSYLNNFTHGVEGGAAWKFLPSTALIYDANLDFQNYNKDDSALSISPVVFADSSRFRTRLGINGAVTRSLSIRALAGYAAIQFKDDNDGGRLDDHEDVVGEAVLALRFGPAQTSQFELGYQRDVVSSALGGWTRIDRGFATVRSLLGRVFLLSLEAGAGNVQYGRLWGYDRRPTTPPTPRSALQPVALGAGNVTDRNDIRLDGAVRGEYRVSDWLSFMADISVQAALTDFEYAVFSGTGSAIPDPARYFAVMAFGGVRAHY